MAEPEGELPALLPAAAELELVPRIVAEPAAEAARTGCGSYSEPTAETARTGCRSKSFNCLSYRCAGIGDNFIESQRRPGKQPTKDRPALPRWCWLTSPYIFAVYLLPQQSAYLAHHLVSRCGK